VNPFLDLLEYISALGRLIFTQAALRTQLGEEAYAVALAEGRLMTLKQLLEISEGA
jgi:hypothetical protein